MLSHFQQQQYGTFLHYSGLSYNSFSGHCMISATEIKWNVMWNKKENICSDSHLLVKYNFFCLRLHKKLYYRITYRILQYNNTLYPLAIMIKLIALFVRDGAFGSDLRAFWCEPMLSITWNWGDQVVNMVFLRS